MRPSESQLIMLLHAHGRQGLVERRESNGSPTAVCLEIARAATRDKHGQEDA
jgi:hypothetical protein